MKLGTIAAVAAALAWSGTDAVAHPKCGTPKRISSFRGPAPRTAIARTTLAIDKLDRDSVEGGTQLRRSRNFAVRWRDAQVSEAEAQMILDELEASNDLYLSLGHRPLYGSEMYRVNLYISAGPDDVAPIDFAGGYAEEDEEGYPYVVIAKELFADGEVWVRSTVAHELYHDFQITTGSYLEDEHSEWFWEASADWAGQERYPEAAESYFYVGAFALAEEVPLFYMGDPFGTDEILGSHQYGASIALRYLTEKLGDRTLVAKTWETGSSDGDALRTFGRLVSPELAVLADHFGDFAAHTALWDVNHREAVIYFVNDYATSFPERSRIDATIGAEGTDWTKVAADRRPGAFGYNVIELVRPVDGKLDLALATPASGATWRATLVRRSAGITYTTLPIVDGAGALSVEMAATEERAWLVVAAIADERALDRRYDYELRVGLHEEPPPPPPGDDGGCAAGGHRGFLGVLAPVMLVVCGRRRARSEHSSRARKPQR